MIYIVASILSPTGGKCILWRKLHFEATSPLKVISLVCVSVNATTMVLAVSSQAAVKRKIKTPLI